VKKKISSFRSIGQVIQFHSSNSIDVTAIRVKAMLIKWKGLVAKRRQENVDKKMAKGEMSTGKNFDIW